MRETAGKSGWAVVAMALVLFAGFRGRAVEKPRRFGLDQPAELTQFQCRGDVGIDRDCRREGAGALKIPPGAAAVLPIRRFDGTGTVSFWVYDDGAAPAAPRKRAAGAMWGLVQKNGFVLAAGAIYAPYLSGAATYAIASFNPGKAQRPWQRVQYLGVRRKKKRQRWTFDFDPDQGLRLLVDGRDVNARRSVFNWDKSGLAGFAAVGFWGDMSGAGQVLRVDDLDVAPGPPARRKPRWPPPPVPPPAGWKGPPPPMAAWRAAPYADWKFGPARSADYFPIAVWLQDPKLAGRYRRAGFNLYVGLWKGPTAAQLETLRRFRMPVICAQNRFGLRRRNDAVIVGWMHGDEPDNAQRFDRYWKSDPERIRQGWPEIYRRLHLDRAPYRGYGPPVPPQWIVDEYRRFRRNDPDRPVLLNLGQGVAWEKYRGRGERTGHLEDYPKYVRGCDIVSFDIYPAAHPDIRVRNALWFVARGIDRLRRWTRDRKIVWNALECTTIGVPGAKPSPAQVRAEVWMSIIHGSRGIIYFVHQFKPKFNAHALLDDSVMLGAVTRINRRIQRLAPVLNRPTLAGRVRVVASNPASPVHILVKERGGALYIFAVAMGAESSRAEFHVTAVSGQRKVAVLGEDRSILLDHGIFRDVFPGNGVHLYRLDETPGASR